MSDDISSLLGPMRPWVEAQVAAGRFATEADAVQAALANLAAQDAKVKNLQRLIQLGLDDVAAGRVHRYDDAQAMIDDIIGKVARK